MEKEKIVLISPYLELSNLAQQLSREQDKNIAIYTAVLDEGVAIARRVAEEDAGVIISRGATGALIKAAVNIPLIQVEITAYDVIEALYKARQVSNKVALFDYWFRKTKHDLAKIQEIIGLPKLERYYYHSEEELNSQIDEAAQRGCQVSVASGMCIISQAQEKGMKGVMIDSSREALQDALTRAEEIVAIRKKDRQLTERLRTIINHSYGGIIAVDDQERISNFNPAAGTVLGIPRERVLGRSLSEDLSQEKSLQKIYAGGKPVLNDVQQVGEGKYLVSRVPLRLDAETFGTVITFQDVSKIQNMEAKIRRKLYNDRGFSATYNFSDIIGSSKALEGLKTKAKKYSQTEVTVLITGESGTGKELFAHSIHRESRRSDGPFVAINCAAIPENLLESELFGYEEGSFTGAKKGGSPGLFEIAHGGSIFLDEVLELPLSLQSRLLRVLQDKAVRRVGGHKVIPVDIRIMAAANRDIPRIVEQGGFREDLYFRINVLNLNISPLRERQEDIPELIDYFLTKHRRAAKEVIPPLSSSHVARLTQYPWPGNVRELESFIEKYVLLAAGEPDSFQLTEELLTDLYQNDPTRAARDSKDKITIDVGTLKEMEGAIIQALAGDTSLDKGELARKLDISRTTLWKKLKG